MSLSCQKHLFDLDPGIHYLNSAYMSPQLKSVEAAGMEALLLKRSPNRIVHQDFFNATEQLRGLFARIVHAPDPGQVSIIPSVSYGMAAVAKNLPAVKGQKIVVAGAQFPSNVYPWMALAEEKGLELEMAPMPPEAAGRGKIWNERLLEAVDARTALVAIGHVHWANGTIFDLKSLADKVHAAGGLIVVDGTQSVGALPLDVQEFGLDALVCAGYKWLMGPYSLGYAWFGKAFEQGKPVEENWINRYNSEDFTRLVDYQPAYQPGGRRYDVGERSNFILTPMAIKALEQLLEWGIGNIQDYCRRLSAEHIALWQENGYVLDAENARAGHMFGLQLPAGKDTATMQQQLKERGVFVSFRGDFVRVAPHVYNDASDMQALTEILLGK